MTRPSRRSFFAWTAPAAAPLASDLIWNELKRCKKPVVASMSDVAALRRLLHQHGGEEDLYCRTGHADGIDRRGGRQAGDARHVEQDRHQDGSDFRAGAHSGILTSDEPFSDTERKTMKALMEDIYDQFVDKALEGRVKAGKKMTRKETAGTGRRPDLDGSSGEGERPDRRTGHAE